MKPFDLLLLSVAIGLTSFTSYMFCTGGAPIEATAPDATIQAPRNPAFKSIVIHHSATHGGSAAAFERNHRPRLGGLAYHFVIGNGSGAADGAVEVGYRWRDQIPGPHTKNQEINLESIAICLVGDLEKEAPTKKQMAALVELLEKLCREGQIAPDRIRSHREVDGETLCPGKGLPIDGLRNVLAGRLSLAAPRPSR
ncbi:MAG: N-acetylmuramoyl-L-alanine amidase [Planctomycetaceae bacterium]|nr:N-acetylmuramoyl-L-alanine amidase [Planctomycetaceae bacterium]